MFPVRIASVLSGASRAQLSYWRKEIAPLGPLLVPESRRGRAFLYSVADVLALRSIVYLREEKSLPKIRKAVAYLKEIEHDDWTHLADYRLIRTAATIYVERPDRRRVDLEAHPGHELVNVSEDASDERSVAMSSVLAEFENVRGRTVPDFFAPREHVAVNRDVLGGFPVIRGTRVPFDVIADLVTSGASSAVIARLYPTVAAEALPSALEFSELIDAAR